MSTFKIRVMGQAQGQAIQNVFHVAAGDASPGNVALDFADAWRAGPMGFFHVGYAFSGVEVENIATEEASVFSVGTTGAMTGGNAGNPLPTWACVSVRLQTDVRGRSGQGRIGFSPVAEDINSANSNLLDSAALTNWQTKVDSWLTDLAASARSAPMTLAVVSYYKGVDAQGKPIKRPTPVVNLVTTATVSTIIGTRLSRHPSR